jgi:hypothetical protein
MDDASAARIGEILAPVASCWACDHPTTELRAKRIGNGGLRFMRQCMVCGASASDWIKRTLVTGEPLAWDDEIEVRWAQAGRERFAAQRAAQAETEAEKAEQRREVYRRYLESPEWLERRRLVLLRDRVMCQGCHKERAVEVHHLTYDHIGRELLFELVSLCAACHAVAHSKKVPLDESEGPW